MDEKACKKCGEIKPLSDYHKHRQTSDGRFGKCKKCYNLGVKERLDKLKLDPEWAEAQRKKRRDSYHRLGHRWAKRKPEVGKKAGIRWRQRFPEKTRAASRSGEIKKKGYEKHHWSYNEEHVKDVIFLSMTDHHLIHRHIIYDQERMMYRKSSDGLLLDDKKSYLPVFEEIGITDYEFFIGVNKRDAV